MLIVFLHSILRSFVSKDPFVYDTWAKGKPVIFSTLRCELAHKEIQHILS